MDELSDEGNRQHLCRVNESEAVHPEVHDSLHAPSSSVSNQNQCNKSVDRSANTDICTNNINNKGDHVSNALLTPAKPVLSATDSKEYSSGKNARRYALKT